MNQATSSPISFIRAEHFKDESMNLIFTPRDESIKRNIKEIIYSLDTKKLLVDIIIVPYAGSHVKLSSPLYNRYFDGYTFHLKDAIKEDKLRLALFGVNYKEIIFP